MTTEYKRPTPEIWKDIPDFIGHQVSNFGRVRSCMEKSVKAERTDRWHICKTGGSRNVYPALCVRINLKTKRARVHRLVAKAFIPNPEGKPQVAHEDGDRSNNHVSNLRWATAKENDQDKEKHGTVMRGERNANAKLTHNGVLNAKRMREEGHSYESIGKHFGLHRETIRLALTGKTWHHNRKETK
jgi:hypothetical protein